MRGRLSVLFIIGALLTGCSSQGTVVSKSGPGSGTTTTADTATTATTAKSVSTSAAPSSGSSSQAPNPVAAKDATVVVGTGKVRVVIYEDYRCPPCKAVHDQIQPAISAKLGAGSIKVELHAVDLVDHTAGGKGSVAAGNAASCALPASKFQPYREALFAAQPTESSDIFADPTTLISIAKTIPGLDSPTFEDCVRTQPYAASIESTYAAEFGSGKLTGTPTVLINGRQWNVPNSGVAASFTQALAATGV